MDFHKNLVIIKSAFKIEHEDKDAPVLACPRCGHVQPRQIRTVCEHCNRLIPTDNTRQNWDKRERNVYQELGELLYDESALAQPEFKKSRKNYELIRNIRNLFLTFLFCGVLLYSGTIGLKHYLGPAKWKKLEKQAEAQSKALGLDKYIKKIHI